MQFKCNEKINQVTENTLVVGMDIAKRMRALSMNEGVCYVKKYLLYIMTW